MNLSFSRPIELPPAQTLTSRDVWMSRSTLPWSMRAIRALRKVLVYQTPSIGSPLAPTS
jgi:hypothetical protein